LGKDSPGRADATGPGTLFIQRNRTLVQCGGTTYLQLTSVKLEGRRQVSAAEFVNGAHLLTSEHFGES
jgi:methionyl-tRNA formyltransferase